MANLKIGRLITRSLFKKPATLMYPVIPREYKEITRGHIAVDMDACILCGICSKKCPTDAISVDKNAKTWSIQRMRCIQCSCCVDLCPKKCLANIGTYTIPNVVKIADTFEKPDSGVEAVPVGSLKCDDSCIYCSICAKKCPAEAITVDRTTKEWAVDDEKCTRCGLCIENCPKNSLTIS